jgi:hypothetical protein
MNEINPMIQTTEKHLLHALGHYVSHATAAGRQHKAAAALVVIAQLKSLADMKAEYENQDEQVLSLLREYCRQCRADGRIEKACLAARAIQHLIEAAE